MFRMRNIYCHRYRRRITAYYLPKMSSCFCAASPGAKLHRAISPDIHLRNFWNFRYGDSEHFAAV